MWFGWLIVGVLCVVAVLFYILATIAPMLIDDLVSPWTGGTDHDER